jgi:hypothetical protein
MLRLCLMWRGEPPEVDFYAFWRVRLALHVTAKGIYILGFCTSTFTQLTSFLYIIIITSYHLHTFNRLLLHLIIVYLLFVCILLLFYIYICVCFLFYCLVSWYRSCRVSLGWGPPPYIKLYLSFAQALLRLCSGSTQALIRYAHSQLRLKQQLLTSAD